MSIQDASAGAGRGEGRGIQSVEVGQRILELLVNADGPLTLTALALAAEMPTSRAHLYLTSFLRLGLVERSGPGAAYDLGPAALRLGLAAMSGRNILDVARDAMIELRDNTGAMVFLSVWGNCGPTVIHRVEGEFWTAPSDPRIGTALPISSATGVVFVASFTAELADEIINGPLRTHFANERWTGRSAKELHAMLHAVRHAGFAVGTGIGSSSSGFLRLAAPIVDHEGSAVAALTMNALAVDSAASPDAAYLRALLAVTRQISVLLGAEPEVLEREDYIIR